MAASMARKLLKKKRKLQKEKLFAFTGSEANLIQFTDVNEKQNEVKSQGNNTAALVIKAQWKAGLNAFGPRVISSQEGE